VENPCKSLIGTPRGQYDSARVIDESQSQLIFPVVAPSAPIDFRSAENARFHRVVTCGMHQLNIRYDWLRCNDNDNDDDDDDDDDAIDVYMLSRSNLQARSRHILISGMPLELPHRWPLRKYQLAKYRALAVVINAVQIFSPFVAGTGILVYTLSSKRSSRAAR